MRSWIGFRDGSYSGENVRYFSLIFILFTLLFVVIPSNAISLSNPHDNLTDNQRLCENCHTNHIQKLHLEIQQSKTTLISNAISQSNNIRSLAATNVVGISHS